MSAQVVLIIDCYIELPGATPNFVRYLDQLPYESCLVAHGQRPYSQPEAYSGIVITGSAASVNDKLPWVEELLPFLLKAIHAGVPVLGVCFGHQLLAYALGGQVQKASRPEVGTVQIHFFKDCLLLAGFDNPFLCFVSHEDEVVSVGSDCEVLARSQQCAIQAFRHVDKAVWGIQFHPEMPTDEAFEILDYRAKRHPELKLDIAALSAQFIERTELARHIFGQFMSCCQSALRS